MEEVKLIGKFSDPINGFGDLFNIPSISNAGNKYIFSMTTSYDDIKGFVAILPISQENSISVNIVGYLNGALFSNENIQYDTTVGKEQHYIAILPLDAFGYNTSITISANSNFFVSYMNPWAATSNTNDASCGVTCNVDYISCMPMPVVSKGCNDAFSRADQRMITNDFTTRLYISPPDIPDHCNELFTMTVYDKNGDEYNETITSAGSSSVELADEYEKAFSTNAGEMRIYRFGSILNHPDNITGYGHFMHYIPSIQEWVKGKTQFYTLAKDCSIEFYADEDGYNPDLITVDGIVLSKYKYTFSYMKYFKKKYGHFILPITRYGLHTIENDGNYILYVICKNVNSAYDAAAYVTGFNKRKAQNF